MSLQETDELPKRKKAAVKAKAKAPWGSTNSKRIVPSGNPSETGTDRNRPLRRSCTTRL